MRAVFVGVFLAGCVMAVGLVEPGARGEEKPKPPKAPGKGYVLRAVAVGDVYKAVRFRRATGEAWELLDGAWQKLEDAAAPPAGEYEVHLLPADPLLAIRIDRATGATWLTRKGKWVRVKEPAMKPGAPKRGPGFDIRHVGLGDQLHVVRFHATTGETWHVNRNAYEALAESTAVAAGEFDITLIAGKEDWMGFRIDRKAGTSWLLLGRKWVKAKEPE
jgi:hypothetical protein